MSNRLHLLFLAMSAALMPELDERLARLEKAMQARGLPR